VSAAVAVVPDRARLTPPPGNPDWLVYHPNKPRTPPSTWSRSQRLMMRELCTRSLADFVEQGWHVLEEGTPLAWGWHLDVLCDHIQAVLEAQLPARKGVVLEPRMPRTGLPRAKCRDLIINVPPGTMKSLVLSVFAVAWMWIRRPSWRVICSSGNESVALRDSVRCRDLLKSEWYRELFEPGWEFSADSDGKTAFKNTKGGVRLVRTAGQAVTGDRGDALFIDDPNDAQQIRSEAYRKRINEDWWSNAMSNRVNDAKTSVRIIIMQRLHEEDLVGYILARERLKRDGGTWEQLVIPMEFEPTKRVNEPQPGEPCMPGQDVATFLGWKDWRYQPGELLMPHRFPPEFIQAEKVSKGSSGYAGQYQQRPAPKDGNKFKRDWWRFWRYDGAPLVQPNRPDGASGIAAALLPQQHDWEDSVESWDLTFKGKDTNDWVVGVKVAKVGAARFVLRLWRKHTGFGGAKAGVIELRSQLPRITGPVVIEEKANGSAVIEELQKLLPGVLSENPKDGKEQRAAVMEPQVEAGNWYLPDGEPWLDDFISEFATFPNGRHDDIVDACSQAAARLNSDSELMQAQVLFGLRATL
jgi:predicted phage terminase large subunit-like protein